ncbi:unnamed protein product [Ixodes persulcatus]
MPRALELLFASKFCWRLVKGDRTASSLRKRSGTKGGTTTLFQQKCSRLLAELETIDMRRGAYSVYWSARAALVPIPWTGSNSHSANIGTLVTQHCFEVASTWSWGCLPAAISYVPFGCWYRCSHSKCRASAAKRKGSTSHKRHSWCNIEPTLG